MRAAPGSADMTLRTHMWHWLQGFDEYMNLVLDDAEEILVKTKTRKPLGSWLLGPALQRIVAHPRARAPTGRVLLKGDNITAIVPIRAAA
jgi:small nuclear ribonucleoprotein (snRNP)-like protein